MCDLGIGKNINNCFLAILDVTQVQAPFKKKNKIESRDALVMSQKLKITIKI